MDYTNKPAGGSGPTHASMNTGELLRRVLRLEERKSAGKCIEADWRVLIMDIREAVR